MIRLGLRENAAQFSLLVLVNAFVQAVMKWEYEPASRSTTQVVMADFKP